MNFELTNEFQASIQMKIVCDCRSIHKSMGGIGQVARNLIGQFGANSRGHSVTALIGGNAPADLTIPGVQLIQVDAAMIDEHFEQLGLPALLTELQADIYFNTTFSVPSLKTCLAQVSIVHDVVFEDHPEWVEPWLRDYLRKWSRFACGQADKVVTVSGHARSRILDVYHAEEEKVVRIYNGIPNVKDNLLPSNNLQSIRHRLGIPESYILYLGTSEPKKGTRELLKSFEALALVDPRVQLIIAGASACGLNLTDLIRNSSCPSRIASLGYVDEETKAVLLASCSLFVYPSLYEGFGLPPLEAMSLGIPTLVHDGSSLPEVVGEAALKVDVRDADAFAQAMERGLHDEVFRTRAKQEGPEQARKYSWEKTANQYLDLFESIAAA